MSIADRQLIAFDIFLKNAVRIGMTNQGSEREFIVLPSFILPAKPQWKDKLFGLCWALRSKDRRPTSFITQITMWA